MGLLTHSNVVRCLILSYLQKEHPCLVAKNNFFFLNDLVARFQNLGEMMTLGRNDAALSPSFIEGLTLEGPIGHTGNVFFFFRFLEESNHRHRVNKAHTRPLGLV